MQQRGRMRASAGSSKEGRLPGRPSIFTCLRDKGDLPPKAQSLPDSNGVNRFPVVIVTEGPRPKVQVWCSDMRPESSVGPAQDLMSVASRPYRRSRQTHDVGTTSTFCSQTMPY